MFAFFSILEVALLLFSLPLTQEKLENLLGLIRHGKASVDYDPYSHITVNTTVINQSSAMVEVTLKSFPNKDNWVGVWLLPNSSSSIDPKNHAPTKYKWCSQGQLKLSFQLINMRGVYQFGLLKGGLQLPTLVAVSKLVRFSYPNQPLQAHLALTNDYSEMLLMWVTRDIGVPEVQWGTRPGVYNSIKKASSGTYVAADMCDSPAMDYGWIDPGMIHKVVMDKLTSGNTYYYKFGSSVGGGGWSKERTFVAPLIPGPSVTTRVLAFGDLGHGEVDNSYERLEPEQPSLITTRKLTADTGNFVMHIGDICYAEGFGATWDEFFYQLQPVMASLPYMVNPGNHECDYMNPDSFYRTPDSGGECNIPYANRFSMPRPGPDQLWYDFVYGSVHVIMMSTEHDFRTSSKQFAALVKYFEAVNRTKTPWLVFSGHRPMYVSSTQWITRASDIQVAKLLRMHIEPLLLKYKVDLALWGHHHSYQRTCPVIDGRCEDGAPVHVVIGMAGQGLSHNILPVKPSYFEVVDDQHYGYTRFTTNSSTLLFEFIRNDMDSGVGDSFIISKR